MLARHGEAEYESDRLSDRGGCLTSLGREQARDLGRSLRDRRIGRVWTSPMARAVQTAEIAAGVLGCDVAVREGLREFGVGAYAGTPVDPDPFWPTIERWVAGDLDARIEGAESGTELIARMRAVLEEVADSHRGEAVLVVGHGGAICAGVPALAANLTASFPLGRPLANCARIELTADGDGWWAESWGGEPLVR